MKPGDMMRTKGEPLGHCWYNVFVINESGDLTGMSGVIGGNTVGIITSTKGDFADVLFSNGFHGAINMRHLEEVER